MKNLYSLIIFLSISFTLSAQTFMLEYSFGDFENATAFSINPTGSIYVTDAGSDEIYKLDTLGQILVSNGGYGWNEGAFDEPVDVFSTPLNIYISDKNNNRVQRFDKDLNFISLLHTRDSDNQALRFGYPLSAVTSSMGDLFVLDSENKRIIKFDSFGKFIQNFGGYNWGSYALADPLTMAISNENNIYVLDKNRIIVYDQYGNGLNIIPLPEKTKNINISFSNLFIITGNSVSTINLKSGDSKFTLIELPGIDDNKNIISASVLNNKLYVLTSNKILVFIAKN